MYKVLCDNALLCDSRIEELALNVPVVTLEENKAGSFSFSLTPKHPFYDLIHRRKSIIEVYRGEELLFSGMAMKTQDTLFKERKITCEGELSYLNDSIQRPARYQGITRREYLETIIAIHNEQVEEAKRFTVGEVTVGAAEQIYCFTNMESTMKCIKEDLVDDFGGIIRIRHENGVKYIDYLEESPRTNSQIIQTGVNLLDFSSGIDSGYIATAVIPLGKKLDESAVEGLETRLTIEAVNDGKDYLVSESAAAEYGYIYKTITFDDVTTAAALKTKGNKYLSETQFENMVIEAKAIDLGLTSEDFEKFRLLDNIRVVSAPHGLNKYFRLTKQVLNLNNPENDSITLGKKEKTTLSAKSTQISEEIKKTVESIVPPGKILNQAQENATQIITSAMGGYVYKTRSELFIMDTDNPETATKVWRWNINGLGYSSNGIDGPYELAMTMDGSIVADFIQAGTMLADRIRGGELALGGINNEDGVENVYDSAGNLLGTWNNVGIKIMGGYGDARIEQNRILLRSNNSNDSIFMYADQYTKPVILVYGQDNNHRTAIRSNAIEVYGFGIYLWDPDNGNLNTFRALNSGTTVTGNFTVIGTKSRAAKTENYGNRLLYCYETPSPMFGDLGEGTLDQYGECIVFIDDIFSETIDSDCRYQVFLQAYGNGNCYVEERNAAYFVVKGTPRMKFGWEIKAVQKGYDTMRIEEFEEEDQPKTNVLGDLMNYLESMLYDVESEEI